ncbi:MAG: alpha/beta fold hydrolase [Candidatus Eremiobacteraeota bacterium]|nr:alpha/beta fold hydrolase [Candidatus Eremiobacteraeota bacterium]
MTAAKAFGDNHRVKMTAGTALVNGTKLYYEVSGQGTAVVLVHGLGLDRRMWDDQFAILAERYRAIRYDLRGFGRSALPGSDAFRHGDDLRALLDHLQAPTAHVVGLSMGGGVALHHGLLYPEATLSLVLVDSALDGHPWSAAWDESLDAISDQALTAGAAAGNERWLAHDLFAPARERAAVQAKLAQIVRDSSGQHWIQNSPSRGIKPRASARLAQISAPTLVVVGERDLPDFQTIAETLAQGIPGARKVVIAGAGHMSNMESSPEFNRTILAFLADVDAQLISATT